MLKLNYIITTLAPITFAEKSGDNVLYATKRYVPGSAVRGALATNFIKKNKLQDAHLDETFYDLFLSGKVRFLPAYPKCKNIDQETGVLPLSLMASKDGKSIKDFSYDSKPLPGYKKLNSFAFVEKATQKIYTANANVQIEFHMSRCQEGERLTGSSKEGNVFNYEYLEPYQDFIGSVIINEENIALVDKIKELFSDGLYLGRSKNAQYGACKCKVLKCDVADNFANFGGQVYLYAYTAYIPYYDCQRVNLLAEDLEAEINTALKEKGFDTTVKILPEKIFASIEAIDGYVGVWNMKRERKNAISAGSMLGIDVQDFDEKAMVGLQEVLLAGLGDRTVEGFGQFRLWSPLKNATMGEIKSLVPSNVLLPKTVKERACKIIQNRILQEVRKQAKQDADELYSKQGSKANDAKGSLKRIENLMAGKLSKQAIQTKIGEEFRQTAMQNLRALRINDASVWDCLLENNNATLPYVGINWSNKLELSDAIQDQLKNDLGVDALNVSDDILFKEYWLWIARFSVKYKKHEDSVVKDAFKNYKGGEH